jgi:hypothetical protein
MMGVPFVGHGMSGFGNVTGRFWSRRLDYFSTGLGVSEGTCDTMGVSEMFGLDKKGAEMKMMEIV